VTETDDRRTWGRAAGRAGVQIEGGSEMLKRAMGIIVGGTLVVSMLGAAPAFARGNDVIQRGSCSGTANWKLKLSPEDNGIQVEFEVDSNVAGQTWHVRLFENGDKIFGGNRQTRGASGSFTVNTRGTDTAGADHFRGRAVNKDDGQTCVGTASIG
jgi:hypothetical protein